MIGLLLAAALAAGPAAPAAATTGWAKRGDSLLLYDAQGELANEIPLGTTEDQSSGSLVVHDMLGGAARNGQFAWTLDRTRTFNSARTKLLDSKHTLKLLGSLGEEVWSSGDGDAPQGQDPVLMSDDGQTVLVSFRDKDGWRVEARGALGNTLASVAPLAELESMQLTPEGKYAVIRWRVPDKSATHTFLNIPAKTRHDVASGDLFLGRAALSADGKVESGGKVVLDLSRDKPQAEASPAPDQKK